MHQVFTLIVLLLLNYRTAADGLNVSNTMDMASSTATPLKSLVILNYKTIQPESIGVMDHHPILYDDSNTIQLGESTNWNQADIQLTTYTDNNDDSGSRPYTYMLKMVHPTDYTIAIEPTDHMVMPESSMHVHRMLMYENNDVAPVCRTGDINTCMTSYHSMKINCVTDGNYPMQLIINDINTGTMLVKHFQLNCIQKPFGSRGDAGHLGPAIPGLLYFTVSMIIWSYYSRKSQYTLIEQAMNNNTQSDVSSELSSSHSRDNRRHTVNTQQNKLLSAYLATGNLDCYVWMTIGFFVGSIHGIIVFSEVNGWFNDPHNVMHVLVGVWMCATGLLHLLAKRSQRFTYQESPDSASVCIILPLAYLVLAALFMMHAQVGALDVVIHQMFAYSAAVFAIMYILAINRRDNIPFMLSYWSIAHINALSFCCACEWMLQHNRWTWMPVI